MQPLERGPRPPLHHAGVMLMVSISLFQSDRARSNRVTRSKRAWPSGKAVVLHTTMRGFEPLCAYLGGSSGPSHQPPSRGWAVNLFHGREVKLVTPSGAKWATQRTWGWRWAQAPFARLLRWVQFPSSPRTPRGGVLCYPSRIAPWCTPDQPILHNTTQGVRK